MPLTIPDYVLYGERGDNPFAECLHIETVPYRSAVYGWKISPHRHHALHQLFWIESGGGKLEIEHTTHALCPPLAIHVPPLVVHGFEFVPGTEGFVASFPVATLHKVLPSAPRALDRALLLPQHDPSEAVARARHLFADALMEHSRSLPGRSEALYGHASLLGVWLLRASGSAKQLGRPGEQARAVLLRRFTDVVERRFADHPSLSEIAGELGVSTPHLQRTCRELLGRSALSLLHERIILEARRCLALTSMPVSEIAFGLGFGDPAYFSRFFRDRVGVTPSVYREKLTTAGAACVQSENPGSGE